MDAAGTQPHLRDLEAAAFAQQHVRRRHADVVEEELRAGPAGTGVPHVPEVVLPQSLDARSGNADGIPPDLLGLVVALVDGDPHPVAVDAQHLGDQLPSKGDGLGLEVVAEAEVPEHLEERAVSVGGADDVDVLGPEALLDRGGT